MGWTNAEIYVNKGKHESQPVTFLVWKLNCQLFCFLKEKNYSANSQGNLMILDYVAGCWKSAQL